MSNQPNCVACDESPGPICMQSSGLVSKMFSDVTGLKVQVHYTICRSCQSELKACYNFKKRCHEIYSLYNSVPIPNQVTETPQRQSRPFEEKIFANPLDSAEISIVKSEFEPSRSAVSYKDDESIHDDDYHGDNPDEEDFEGTHDDDFGQYEDINPPMSDDDDSATNDNDPDFEDSSARFECDECSKAFSKRSRLVAHKAEHRNERLYSCPRPGCNSAFNVPHRLTRHLRNVHDADEEEINESTFALVEDSEGVYVVRSSWMFSKDGNPYIYYPPPSLQQPEHFAKFFNKPGDDWVQYQVKILRQKIPSYELTKRLQNIRLQKRNLKTDSGPQAKKSRMPSDFNNSSHGQQGRKSAKDEELEEIFPPFEGMPTTSKEKIPRRTYTLCHKLDAIVYAEATSVSKAAEYYGVNMSQIKRWKKQKDLILSKDNKMGKVVKRVRSKKRPPVEVIING